MLKETENKDRGLRTDSWGVFYYVCGQVGFTRPWTSQRTSVSSLWLRAVTHGALLVGWWQVMIKLSLIHVMDCRAGRKCKLLRVETFSVFDEGFFVWSIQADEAQKPFVRPSKSSGHSVLNSRLLSCIWTWDWQKNIHKLEDGLRCKRLKMREQVNIQKLSDVFSPLSV